MKRAYNSPTMAVVQLRHAVRLCSGSDWDVLEPGEPNLPAGAREYGDADLWEED